MESHGFVVLEINGAVDFHPEYSLDEDIGTSAVRVLLESVTGRQMLAAVSGI